jgi:hypothetical protein
LFAQDLDSKRCFPYARKVTPQMGQRLLRTFRIAAIARACSVEIIMAAV